MSSGVRLAQSVASPIALSGAELRTPFASEAASSSPLPKQEHETTRADRELRAEHVDLVVVTHGRRWAFSDGGRAARAIPNRAAPRALQKVRYEIWARR
jgi:hypothetical protein